VFADGPLLLESLPGAPSWKERKVRLRAAKRSMMVGRLPLFAMLVMLVCVS
jgi:hypothetical protein